jgi:hypothetical protein
MGENMDLTTVKYKKNEYDLIMKDENENYYGVYTNPKKAVAEVIYSNLSNKLELSCVQTQYTDLLGLPFSSLSNINKKWNTYTAWSKKHSFKQLENTEQYNCQQLFSLLFLGVWGSDNYMGFVDKNNKFIKANNGALFSYLVSCCIQNRKSMLDQFKITPMYFKSIVLDYLTIIPILDKMLELTDENFKECIIIPEWKHKEKVYDLFLDMFVNARELIIEAKK